MKSVNRYYQRSKISERVIQYLFRYWLPRSRYQPANLPGMEIYRRQPAEMGWEEYDMDCAVPGEAKLDGVQVKTFQRNK